MRTRIYAVSQLAHLAYQKEAWFLAGNSLNSSPDSGSQKKLPLVVVQTLNIYHTIDSKKVAAGPIEHIS